MADPEFRFQRLVGLLQLGGAFRHPDFQVLLGPAQGFFRLDPGDGAAHLGRQGLQGRPGRGRHLFILVGGDVDRGDDPVLVDYRDDRHRAQTFLQALFIQYSRQVFQAAHTGVFPP